MAAVGRAVDRAEDALRDLILSGDLRPGERLGEVELAAALGMSRTPVREALRRLSNQGLVDVESNKGARVTAWSDAELEQVFVLRAHLEGLAAAGTARNATDEQVEQLDRLAHEMVGVALPYEQRDLPRLSVLNGLFHALLLDIAGSSTLTGALSGLVHASVLTRTQHALDEAAMHRSVHHHLEIVAAVRARDPDWAQSVMHSHLYSARASLLGPRPHSHPPDPEEPLTAQAVGRSNRVRTQAERFGVVVAWLVVIIVFSVLMPRTFANLDTARLVLSTQTVILVAALGLMLSLAVGEYDLSIGSVVGFGGTLLAVLNGVAGWSPAAAIVATLVVCVLIGVVNAVLSVYVGVQSIIITLGTGTLLAGITLAIADSKVVTGISDGIVGAMTDPVLLGIPAPFYAGVVLCAALWFVLQHTPLGRRMVFVAENREVARLAGLRVRRIRAGALVATSTLGGVAGIVLAGTNSAANPQAGSSYLLPAFAAAFLGSTAIVPGRFNAWGTFIAVYFLVTGITGLQYLGYAGWPEQVFYGGSLVLAVTLSHLAGRRRLAGP